MPSFQGTQEVCRIEKVAKEVICDAQYSFYDSLPSLMKNIVCPGLSKRQGWQVFGQDWAKDQEATGKVEKVVELLKSLCICIRSLTWFGTCEPFYRFDICIIANTIRVMIFRP